jgi:hypothetical protein
MRMKLVLPAPVGVPPAMMIGRTGLNIQIAGDLEGEDFHLLDEVRHRRLDENRIDAPKPSALQAGLAVVGDRNDRAARPGFRNAFGRVAGLGEVHDELGPDEKGGIGDRVGDRVVDGVLGGIEGLAGELLIGELFFHGRGDRGLHRDGFDRVKPEALSPESMTQSELSSIAVATSLTSARVGRGWEVIESSIWVAVMTGLPYWRQRRMILR